MDDKKTPMLNNAAYNVLKWIAQIFLPGLGTLYATLGGVWNLPHVNEVVSTIVAVDLFLGLLLGVSSKSYNASDAKYDGNIDVSDGVATINVEGDPAHVLQTKDELSLKINKDMGDVPIEVVAAPKPAKKAAKRPAKKAVQKVVVQDGDGEL